MKTITFTKKNAARFGRLGAKAAKRKDPNAAYNKRLKTIRGYRPKTATGFRFASSHGSVQSLRQYLQTRTSVRTGKKSTFEFRVVKKGSEYYVFDKVR